MLYLTLGKRVIYCNNSCQQHVKKLVLLFKMLLWLLLGKLWSCFDYLYQNQNILLSIRQPYDSSSDWWSASICVMTSVNVSQATFNRDYFADIDTQLNLLFISTINIIRLFRKQRNILTQLHLRVLWKLVTFPNKFNICLWRRVLRVFFL